MNKQKELALHEAFEKFMNMSLMQMHITDDADQVIAEDVMGYGTTLEEVIDSFEEWKALINIQIEQGVKLEFRFDRHPYYKRISAREDTALLVETIATNIIAEGFKNEFTFRISVVLEYTTKDSWQVIHWHGSIPSDTENDSWHVNEWKKKNELLEKLVEEQTVELIEKNFSLEIDASVERVRATAQGMRSPNDIMKVLNILREEMLKFELNNIATWIWIIDDQGHITQWDISEVINKDNLANFNFTFDPKKYPQINKHILNQKKNKSYYNLKWEGKQLQELINHVSDIDHVSGKMFQEAVNAGQIKTYWQSASPFLNGLLGLDFTNQPSDKTALILTKMADAFGLAYQRFTELQKAEAQAREGQIEAALERVRSRSLAMHKTSELQEVIHTVHKELLGLNIAIEGGSFIALNSEIEEELNFWGAGGTADSSEEIKIPRFEKPFYTNLLKRIQNGPVFFTEEFTQEEKKEFFTFLFKYEPWSKLDTKQKKETLMSSGGYTRSCCVSKYTSIIIINHFGQKFSEDDNNILKRFGKVFEQSYIRFLDLQKAEAQAREAEIELALERIRARTMAMQNSEELQEAALLLFQQIEALGIPPFACGFNIWDEDRKAATAWMGSVAGLQPAFKTDSSKDVYLPIYKAAKKSEALFVIEQSGKELEAHYDYLATIPTFRDIILEDWKRNGISTPTFQIIHCAFFSKGYLMFISFEPVTAYYEIFKRFAKVFEQTYTRFLDLQKAEEQARESQIEAALEKVRSRSMAMHKSDELLDVITVVSEQLLELNFRFAHVSFANNELDQDYKFWVSARGMPNPMQFTIPYIDIRMINNMREAQQQGVNFYTDILTKLESKQWHNHLLNHGGADLFPKEVNEYSMNRGMARSIAINPNIILVITNYASVPYSDEENKIISRFGQVFEQSYTRFLDLQKAEAQAREAQIEAALEKVRSRSMAMHNSEELSDVITVVSEQLLKLNFRFNHVSFANSDIDEVYRFWTSDPRNPKPLQFTVPYIDIPMFNHLKEAKQNGLQFFAEVLTVKENQQWHNQLLKYCSNDLFSKEENEYILSRGMARSVVIHPNIILLLANYASVPYSEEQNKIIVRFGQVFEQSYTRFLDLQKAEAQAREAVIEAALEKVRGKAMAMHTSSDLSATASLVFTELRKLGINPIRCGVGMLEKKSRKAQLYATSVSDTGDNLALIGWIKLSGHPVLENIYTNWISNVDYFPEMTGEELKSYYKKLLSGLSVPSIPDSDEKNYGNFFLQSNVCCLYAWADRLYNEVERTILKRFAAIIDLTFRRYLELQKSEIAAKEAIRQASLDRVRAEIASMRSTKDLDRITPLIWKELNTLRIPFIRCGVFIMDEMENKVHTYLSTPNGQAIAAFHTPMDNSGNLAGAIESWKKQKVFVTNWVESDFQTQADILLEQGSITSREQYLNTIPKEGFHLHFLPFRQGMLYVGSNDQLQSEVLQLVESLAEAFSVAYARYEDFTKLESAKEQIEKTLTDLKQTQTQLIQAEKMASLGELTAGIAHEIQNPLNFVNNFSEVSTELIDEMNEEIAKGNTEDVKEIASDLKQNLIKINHHGKRAGDIVKGMLQHSRSNSGTKEQTDINVLADEYLRLAYHGLRAKDKSFNAKFETDFDAALPKLNVVPQDIGRVILNLITNAFYVVNEKAKLIDSSYEPQVIVSTHFKSPSGGGKGEVMISVKDNGIGILEHVREKVFQPFFTTKPTGQGTGLGLSLSYDIVKAHDGDIRIESKENEGTDFIITIPIK